MSGWTVLLAAVQLVAGPAPGAGGAAPAAPAAAASPVAASAGASARGALYTEAARAPAPPPQAMAGLPDLSRLAEAAIPAVVGVVTLQPEPPQGQGSDDGLRELFDKLHDGPRRGIGSGFVIQRDGWVLTNAHVVEGADRVEVDLGGGVPRLAARVVGLDGESDVALLKVDAPRPLPVVPLGDSDRITVAEWVMVIGSPFGLDHSVTLGIISHTGRNDISPVGRPGTYDFIQTDASINPGNSGGPLLNLRGEVVGIATAVNATGQGIGFAIPINMAKEIVGQLRERGRVVRSWMGVSVRELTPQQGVPPGGVEITEVAAGGPAAVAGLRPGDVIISIQGHAVHTPSRLRWYVSTAGVGREVELRLRRAGNPERTQKVLLAEVPVHEQARAEARQVLGE
ncbi:2-alkenal reductase [Anaeromyxobacter dehalogenans 2CP-1]|uniref:2-alkenal reductase n=1 Tax=Anaeromyxobacter dehalogenans (strain ATCC BAA-258 / DSM 21875 / 2CP-1) TaxID=455488 RepID=B8JFZ9_ANAD2|nr:trypsin-like peptidase domain-containing protein [Anaeromyxobacter dehalogenans]ACL64587.1 2-alkenal reductase [Anaeromyxobacter dehalogenans 2CP-1]